MAELSAAEMASVTRACRHVAVPEPPPAYLRWFLVVRLDRDDPRLAETVAGLDSDRCAALLRADRLLQRVEPRIGEPTRTGASRPDAGAYCRPGAGTAPDHRA
jgi:hypothetical protein